MHAPSRVELLRKFRADMTAVCPNWRTDWPELLVGGKDCNRLEYTMEVKDGSPITLVLMCRGGFDGERIDGFDRGDHDTV